MYKGNNDGMVLHEVISLLCVDHENRRRAHKRIPLVTLIDIAGMYLGYYCGLRPLDMADMLSQYTTLNEWNAPVIDIIRDPEDCEHYIEDRNIIIRCKWPMKSDVHRWTRDV